jgi:uncharacterized protein (TIGR03437 family)
MRFLFSVLFLLPLASAQQYAISTVAGIGLAPFGGEGGAALNAHLIAPRGVAVDSAGNIFVSDLYYNQVFRISTSGAITTYAGTGQLGFSGDGGPATAAQLNQPGSLALDSAGNLYIADGGTGRVRKVSTDGTITTSAIVGASGVAVDTAGNLYISQSTMNVIHLVRPNGTDSIIAGNGKPGFSGDNGPATAAQLFTPLGLKVDAMGNVFVADSGNNRIRKITPQGIITTVAGSAQGGFAGDNLSATTARIFAPTDVGIDSKGNFYITDSNNSRIRVVSPTGIISTFAGGVSAGATGTSLNDGPAEQAYLSYPAFLAIDGKGIIVTEQIGRQVRRVTPQGTITTIAGLSPTASAENNIAATSATLLGPYGVAIDGAGAIYISDTTDQRIKKVSTSGILTTFAGNGVFGSSPNGGPALIIGNPRGLAFDRTGNLYVSSGDGYLIRRITPNGTINTVAGGGTGSDGGAAVGAQLQAPTGVVVDTAGNIYIADTGNERVRRVDTTGKISTIAGTGEPAYAGDNGPATAAKLFGPRQLALDRNGNLFIADAGNNRIRKITPAGTITTVAGSGATGLAGDGGPATAAQLNVGGGLAVDAAGNLYITTGSKIRRVDATTGVISTIAGTGVQGFSGDGGLATAAMLDAPNYLALDGSGNIYFTDLNNQRVRKLSPAQITPDGVRNGASSLSGAVAPGEIVVISGMALGPDGTQVLFDGIPATLLSAQASQVTAIVPYEVAAQASTQLQIAVNGKNTNTAQIPVAETAPGIFTQDSSGKGAAVILNTDSTINSPANPAARGSLVTITATGEGQTNPPGVDGLIASDTPPVPIAPVSVQIGGSDAPLMSAGGVSGQSAGYFQVVVQVPNDAPTGDAIPIVLTVGGVASQPGVTVSVQ